MFIIEGSQLTWNEIFVEWNFLFAFMISIFQSGGRLHDLIGRYRFYWQKNALYRNYNLLSSERRNESPF